MKLQTHIQGNKNNQIKERDNWDCSYFSKVIPNKKRSLVDHPVEIYTVCQFTNRQRISSRSCNINYFFNIITCVQGRYVFPPTCDTFLSQPQPQPNFSVYICQINQNSFQFTDDICTSSVFNNYLI